MNIDFSCKDELVSVHAGCWSLLHVDYCSIISIMKEGMVVSDLWRGFYIFYVSIIKSNVLECFFFFFFK